MNIGQIMTADEEDTERSSNKKYQQQLTDPTLWSFGVCHTLAGMDSEGRCTVQECLQEIQNISILLLVGRKLIQQSVYVDSSVCHSDVVKDYIFCYSEVIGCMFDLYAIITLHECESANL